MPPVQTYSPQAERGFYEANLYSAAARAGDLLFISGVIGFTVDPGGEPVIPRDIAEEVRAMFHRLAGVLAEADLGMEDLVDIDTFIDGASFTDVLTIFQEVKVEFLCAPFPAWTAVPVPFVSFPGARLELKAVARSIGCERH